MNHSRVLVLGSGPAGLMVAHACSRAGVNFEIMSDSTEPSFISGAQYLHRYIPGLMLPPQGDRLRYERRGSAEGYARKIYGERVPPDRTSWGRFPDEVEVWSLKQAYQMLWKMYSPTIIHDKVDHFLVPDLLSHYGAVFSTIPMPELAHPSQRDRFLYQTVWIVPGDFSDADIPYNTIIYSGHSEDDWYRKSNIFGHTSIEFPNEPDALTADGAIKIRKPLWYEGEEAWPQIYKFGRYGKWDKSQLVDDAFQGAINVLLSRPSSSRETSSAF